MPEPSKLSMPNAVDVIENLWLGYYNDVLYQTGLITDEEYEQMCAGIAKKAPATSVEI